ncbi:MAG TPA: beta-galactosidase [Arachidicoccus sp.]|nr:beta-galactosidase [Arachidicoccus sp.]
MAKYLSFLFFLMTVATAVNAQQVFRIDASEPAEKIISGALHMGDPGPQGKEILANSRYLTIGGKAVVPVMGEVHYSRIPRAEWDDVLSKMKACGVNIVACYVLWIHHEEIEGKFDWSDNKDLSAFIACCQKHGMYAYPRIGPWCHAEVRNGGTPDWLLEKPGIKLRTNDPLYEHYVEILYQQIAMQLKGHLYKNGGPVIGVQLENEYGRGKAGESYILWLKRTARKYGIDVPLYTVTGWGNASVPASEVIPLWGAYPDEPWATNIDRNTSCENYQFTAFRDNDKIGNEAGGSKVGSANKTIYPYFTCEMGVGIQNTDHRRLKIGKLDGAALMLAKLGSGSNLIGYYMFAGGSNPHGALTSLEETQRSGSWNTNPVISYDFQAAIRETGILNNSYFEIKKIHYFLNEFGGRLAPMTPYFPAQESGLQYGVRASKEAAFVFGINYCRHNIKTEVKAAQFEVKLGKERIRFPQNGISIPDSSLFIWPVNFTMDKVLLKYATAQPLGCVRADGLQNWIFTCDVTDQPEFCLEEQGVRKITCQTATIQHKNGYYYIVGFKDRAYHIINVEDAKGVMSRIIILSKSSGNSAWLLKRGQEKRFYLSKQGMYENREGLHLFGFSNEFQLKMLGHARRSTRNSVGEGGSGLLLDSKQLPSTSEDIFQEYSFSVPQRKGEVKVKNAHLLADADRISIPPLAQKGQNVLLKNLFFKHLKLDNPSGIRQATFYFLSDAQASITINNRIVQQEVRKDGLNQLDITGYLSPGNNDLLVSFPTNASATAFMGHLTVIHNNYDREVFLTDSTWKVRVAYTFPHYPYALNGFKKVDILASKPMDPAAGQSHAFVLTAETKGDHGDFILRMQYEADKARLYHDGRLMADDFYNGDLFDTHLSGIGSSKTNSGNSYTLILKPLQKDYRKYFDETPPIKQMEAGILKNVWLIPEYKVNLKFR